MFCTFSYAIAYWGLFFLKCFLHQLFMYQYIGFLSFIQPWWYTRSTYFCLSDLSYWCTDTSFVYYEYVSELYKSYIFSIIKHIVMKNCSLVLPNTCYILSTKHWNIFSAETVNIVWQSHFIRPWPINLIWPIIIIIIITEV